MNLCLVFMACNRWQLTSEKTTPTLFSVFANSICAVKHVSQLVISNHRTIAVIENSCPIMDRLTKLLAKSRHSPLFFNSLLPTLWHDTMERHFRRPPSSCSRRLPGWHKADEKLVCIIKRILINRLFQRDAYPLRWLNSDVSVWTCSVVKFV